MKEVTLEAKNKEEVIKKACEALNANESEIIYHIHEEKGKLFKPTIYTIRATTLNEIKEELQKHLQKIVDNLGLHTKIEGTLENRKFDIKMASDNNQILIGKNGQTLKSLEIMLKQYISSKYDYRVSVSLDVENYKEQKIKNLERLAKRTAREVASTNMEVHLENMNSFERRVVHNALTNYKKVKTISEGEEPNRHVIIKPVD